MPVSDRTLVARARAGDTTAFAVLFRRHRARLERVCAHVAGEQGADVAQDAALVAWLQLDRLRDPERFGSWLLGIGRFLALSERRAHRSELTPDGSLPQPEPAGDDDPMRKVLAAERSEQLAAAIAELPPGQRDAVVLFHLAELPQARIAALLGTPVGAVSNRLYKARAALRGRFAPQEAPTMIPASILDVRRTPAGRHVVILSAGEHELPIWIGVPEAEALVAGLERVELPRPHAHALTLSLLRACGRRATAVRVARLEGGIFYAEVVLDDGTAVDARPSDALVLSVIDGLPIEVDSAVLASTREVKPDDYAADLAQAAENGSALLAEELRGQLATAAAELARITSGAPA